MILKFDFYYSLIPVAFNNSGINLISYSETLFLIIAFTKN